MTTGASTSLLSRTATRRDRTGVRSARWSSSVYSEDATTIDDVCWRTLQAVNGILEPECRFIRSSSLAIDSVKGDLVLDLVQAVGGTSYLTGEPGLAYLPVDRFAERGIDLIVQAWQAPTAKRGLLNPSIIDLLANRGPDFAREILSRPRFSPGDHGLELFADADAVDTPRPRGV